MVSPSRVFFCPVPPPPRNTKRPGKANCVQNKFCCVQEGLFPLFFPLLGNYYTQTDFFFHPEWPQIPGMGPRYHEYHLFPEQSLNSARQVILQVRVFLIISLYGQDQGADPPARPLSYVLLETTRPTAQVYYNFEWPQ